jgi:hypothetical protein
MRSLLKPIVFAVCCTGGLCAASAPPPNSDTLFKALSDELQRSMTLRLGISTRPISFNTRWTTP